MGKILNFKNLSFELKKIRGRNKIILVGGCFDILHAAHIEFLNKAKRLGGKLIIILESDQTIKKLKGKNRPINSQKDRAVVLSNLSMVDYVIILPPFQNDNEYFELVKIIKPDIIAVTDNDPVISKKIEQAKMVNGKIITVMKRQKNYSSYNIVEKLLS